jgi:Ca2+/H+ antiporter
MRINNDPVDAAMMLFFITLILTSTSEFKSPALKTAVMALSVTLAAAMAILYILNRKRP